MKSAVRTWMIAAALLAACSEDSSASDDGGTDGGDQLECDDLVPCTEPDGGPGSGYECEGEPVITCWNLTWLCSEFLCATHEQACLVACHTAQCDQLDSDPPIPDCSSY